jgi:hypothetical protein
MEDEDRLLYMVDSQASWKDYGIGRCVKTWASKLPLSVQLLNILELFEEITAAFDRIEKKQIPPFPISQAGKIKTQSWGFLQMGTHPKS